MKISVEIQVFPDFVDLFDPDFIFEIAKKSKIINIYSENGDAKIINENLNETRLIGFISYELGKIVGILRSSNLSMPQYITIKAEN